MLRLQTMHDRPKTDPNTDHKKRAPALNFHATGEAIRFCKYIGDFEVFSEMAATKGMNEPVFHSRGILKKADNSAVKASACFMGSSRSAAYATDYDLEFYEGRKQIAGFVQGDRRTVHLQFNFPGSRS
jgi:hypothetical protein